MAGRDILDFAIARPPDSEISEIAAAWRAADVRIETEQNELVQLQSLKTALMDDLLTGRVRVTPLLEGATP
jgi:type I restriction enzyme S subunit